MSPRILLLFLKLGIELLLERMQELERTRLQSAQPNDGSVESVMAEYDCLSYALASFRDCHQIVSEYDKQKGS